MEDVTLTVLTFLISLVQILFIIFKLSHIITWSWIGVLSPLWITLGFVFICLLIEIIGTIMDTIKSPK